MSLQQEGNGSFTPAFVILRVTSQPIHIKSFSVFYPLASDEAHLGCVLLNLRYDTFETLQPVCQVLIVVLSAFIDVSVIRELVSNHLYENRHFLYTFSTFIPFIPPIPPSIPPSLSSLHPSIPGYTAVLLTHI